MRILVCLENDHRTYREVVAAGIQILRPDTEVVTAELDGLKEEVRRGTYTTFATSAQGAGRSG